MARPAGRPVADQVVMVAVDDESVALLARAVMGTPVGLDCRPGLVTVSVLVMAQVNGAVNPPKPALSVAVMTTENGPPVLGVPVMSPVGDMESPAGSPAAAKLSVAVDDESVALICSAVTGVPDGLAWAPGLVTTTRLSMAQVKLAEPA